MAPASPGPLSTNEAWNLVAEGYAAEAPVMMGYFAQRAVELAGPAQAARVLDVAAGSGVLTLAVAALVAQVDAIDFSPNMLAQLAERQAALGIQNVTAQLGDGQALPFMSDSYDAAFSMFGLMFFPNRPLGFAELFRCLKPGGVAVVSSWAPVSQSPLMLLMFDTLRALDPNRAPPETNLLSLENPELFDNEMRAAGFVDVSVTPYVHEVTLTSAESYWTTVTRGGAPFALLRKRMGETEWQKQSQLATDYLKTRISGPLTLSSTAYLGFGRKPS
jgi:ubiquinone/menaquinone biosynthesis C-methylase UbiE